MDTGPADEIPEESAGLTVRAELLNRRAPVPPLQILLHHIIDDEFGDILVWIRLIRRDGTEGFTILNLDDAAVISAIHSKTVKWVTRLVTKRRTRLTEAEELALDAPISSGN